MSKMVIDRRLANEGKSSKAIGLFVMVIISYNREQSWSDFGIAIISKLFGTES